MVPMPPVYRPLVPGRRLPKAGEMVYLEVAALFSLPLINKAFEALSAV